jgi:hypothetical protein
LKQAPPINPAMAGWLTDWIQVVWQLFGCWLLVVVVDGFSHSSSSTFQTIHDNVEIALLRKPRLQARPVYHCNIHQRYMWQFAKWQSLNWKQKPW